MYRIFLCSIALICSTSHSMKLDALLLAAHSEFPDAPELPFAAPPIKQEVGFNTQHYKDFLRTYFDGKETEGSQVCYMNFCLRDNIWALYKEFLKEGGTYFIDIIEKPTSDSAYDMRFMKLKLFELSAGVRGSLQLIDQLEAERAKKEAKQQKKKKYTQDE